MPRIMVVAANGGEIDNDSSVTLDERFNTVLMEDQHASFQFLERLAWAVEDAERLERDDPRFISH